MRRREARKEFIRHQTNLNQMRFNAIDNEVKLFLRHKKKTAYVEFRNNINPGMEDTRGGFQKRLDHHVEYFDGILMNPFVFRRGRSTTDCVSVFVADVTKRAFLNVNILSHLRLI